jgi:hypothetical protein
MLHNYLIESLTDRRCQLLGVLHSSEAGQRLTIEWKNDGGCHNWTSEATAASLVDSSNKGIALREQGHFFF